MSKYVIARFDGLPARRETVETVLHFHVGVVTGLKPGVNENGSERECWPSVGSAE